VNVETHNRFNQNLLTPELSSTALALVSTSEGVSVESNDMTDQSDSIIEGLNQTIDTLTAERDQLREALSGCIRLVEMYDNQRRDHFSDMLYSPSIWTIDDQTKRTQILTTARDAVKV